MRGLPCEDSWRTSRECANLLAWLPVFAVLRTLTSVGPYNSNQILEVHQTVKSRWAKRRTERIGRHRFVEL